MTSNEGRRLCVPDGVCLCSRTWVLVIHNDFKGIKKYERLGDDTDVRNLQRVFEEMRGCRFRELHNRGSEEIVQTLAQEEVLIQLFQSEDDSILHEPEVFILFILSHGEPGGIILTDHFKKDTDPAELKFESYNTGDVWNLAKINFISKSLKLLFLGPCRGNSAEHKLFELGKKNKSELLSPSGWLSAKPNQENFVILYSTVESMAAHRHESEGTWFVQAVCSELENLQENQTLLVFLTKIQFSLCNRNKYGNLEIGQTSQLHYFFHDKFTVCATSTDNKNLNLQSIEPPLERPDCAAKDDIGTIRIEMENATAKIMYDWRDKKGIQLKRGKALIFHDKSHYVCALKINISLQELEYKTSLHDLSSLNAIITNTRQKRNFEHDGSFVLFVLAQLSETENGLILKDSKNFFQLSKIIDEFTGTKCTQLVGKPKLFFFLDDGIKSDGDLTTEEETTIGSYKFCNLHAGVCTFVGVRIGAEETGGDVIENLVQALRSPQLKEEVFNLQTVLSEVIGKASKEKCTDEEENRIKPQFLSTLPQLLNFPPLQSPYELEKYNIFHRFIGAAHLMTLLFAFTLLIFGFALRTEQIFPTRLLLVDVDDTCGISFTGSNISRTDVFSLKAPEWSKKNANCSDDWKKKYSPDYVIIDYISNSSLDKAVWQLEKSENKRESVYRIVLFGYTRSNVLKMIKFSSLLNTSKLQLDVLRSVVAKMNVNRDFKNIAILELSHYFRKYSNIEREVQKSVDTLTRKIVHYICFDYNLILFDSIKTLSDATQKHFVPFINVECFRKIAAIPFKELAHRTKTEFVKYACSAYHVLFLEMKNQNQLKSSQAFQIRWLSESIQNSAMSPEETQRCKEVADSLKSHEIAHMEPYLELYDKRDSETIRGLYPYELSIVVPNLVKMRYNGRINRFEKAIDIFWEDYRLFCTVALTLVEEFRKNNTLASFMSLHTFTGVKYHNYKSRSDVIDPNDEVPWSKKCLNASRMAPQWIQEFLFDAEPLCDYKKDQMCTDSVINDLDTILTNFETQNLTQKREIFFLDFVINSINKSSADMWHKLQPLAERVELFKEDMVSKLIQNMLDEYTETNDDGDGSLLYAFYGPKVFKVYLPIIAREAYLKEGIDNMPAYLYNFNSIPEGGIWCDGVSALYSVMEQNPQDLESTEAFLLWNYIYALIEMPTTVPLEERFRDITFEAKDKCNQVLNGLRNYSEAGMDKYEQLYRNNDSQSLQELYDMHENYWFGTPWVIPRLIDRLQRNNESFAFSVLYLLSSLPSNAALCPGIQKLFVQTDCKNVSSGFCENFTKSLCNTISNNHERSTLKTNDYLSRLCKQVKSQFCLSFKRNYG